MPSTQWLKTAFDYGFDSGNVESRFPNRRRRHQERRCGGSYREVFRSALLPHLTPDSTVLEIGPGKGSWSRAILNHVANGRLYTADYVEVDGFLHPERYDGRLVTRRVQDNSFGAFPDEAFDLVFSFGVLCHNPADSISEVLRNTLPKLKPGGVAVHQHGEWDKLEAFGWAAGGVPEEFKDQPDEEIWWPRNTSARMAELARGAGWTVEVEDLALVKRDGLIRLRRDG